MRDAEKQRLVVQVTGRVQGVGFRHFTRQEARRLGLIGWVRNEADGSVRVVAEGPREALEQLLDALRHGPASALVSDVEADWQAATGDFDAFEVAH